MARPTLATAWLDACSGCHMSMLDLDEGIAPLLLERAELVYCPLLDAKELPARVDVCLISGAVSTDEDLHKARLARQRARLLVAFGDCAVTGNVPAMRNRVGPLAVLEQAYTDRVENPQVPCEGVPRLLERVRPLHEVVTVDAFIQGCPPHPELIGFVLNELLEGRLPGRGIRTKFG